jgi:hypothetical protein
MKRNRNFLLIVWAASLLGLSAVQTAHAVTRIPASLGVYESPREKDGDFKGIPAFDSVHGLLSSSEFNPEQTSYDLLSAYKSRSLLLVFSWEIYPGTDVLGGTDSAKVKVFVDGKEIEAFSRPDTVKGATPNTKYDLLSFAEVVYVIPFGSGVDSVRGKVEVTFPDGVTKQTYEAVVRRGVVDDITALRNIWITDSIGKELAGGSTVAFQDTIFKEVAGADGKLKPEDEPWVVSFANGEHKDIEDSDLSTRGRADTLYFTKYDPLSTVQVIVNNRDTLKLSQKNTVPVVPNTSNQTEIDSIVHIGSEIYKVKIHAGNSYAIEVTARDTVTKSRYYVTLLADTIKTLPTDGTKKEATLRTLKDLYLYEGDQKNPSKRYNLKQENGGVGFDTLQTKYRVTVAAPWSAISGENPSIKVGYSLWKDSKLKDENVEVFQSVSEGKKLIRVFTKVTDGTDSAYTIEVLSGNLQLKSLRLSYDMEGLKPLELTRDSAGDYTSAAVDYTVARVFAWVAFEDEKAKAGEDKWYPITNEYRKVFEIDTLVKQGGGHKTFNVPVVAEDTTLVKNYKVTVKMKWDPTPKKVTFTWSGGGEEFSRDQLRAGNLFDIPIPAVVDIEEVVPVVEKSEDNLFRVFSTWNGPNNGVYSFIVKVTAKEDGATKTYTFNLLRPSSDASLSYLSVREGFALSPAFDPAIVAYTVIVPSEQESIDFIAVTNHEKAKITGDRKHTLHGDSTFAIVVTAEDGTEKTYRITVTGDPHTGIQLAGGSSVQVYVSDQSLHVSTPAAERVSVYSAGGQLLYSLDKPAGKAFVSTFPKGVLIVKGSSGWVKKVALH